MTLEAHVCLFMQIQCIFQQFKSYQCGLSTYQVLLDIQPDYEPYPQVANCCLTCVGKGR